MGAVPHTSDGVTRYPIGFRHATKRFPPMLVLAAGVAAAALAWSVANDTDWLLIVVPLVAGLLVPVGSLLLPTVEQRAAAYVIATVAVSLVALWTNGLEVDFVIVYAAALWLGHVAVVWAVRLREWRRRLASSSGAPPSGLDPGTRRRLPLLATWFDQHVDCERREPHPESVLDAIRRLDGDGCSLVSVLRGHARLDVGGDARAGLIVQQTDNRHRWPHGGHHLTSTDPGTGDADLTTVRFAQTWVAVPGSCVVALADAEAAVTTWLTSGRRDPSLTWAPAREIAVPRPRVLTAQDQPWQAWRDGFATGTLGSPVQLPYGGGGGTGAG